jgi:GTP-binding protein
VKIPAAQFVTSRADLKTTIKPAFPEIAFAGRSNVGKSSLINSLLNRRKLALVSKRPGKTQLLNYYEIDGRFYFVDLPGYGFARVPKAMRRKWGQLVEGYLRESAQLRGVVVILDSRRGVTDDDHELLDWLRAYRRPSIIVLTKMDKLNASEQREVISRHTKELHSYTAAALLPYSATENRGRDELWKAIFQLLYAEPDS